MTCHDFSEMRIIIYKEVKNHNLHDRQLIEELSLCNRVLLSIEKVSGINIMIILLENSTKLFKNKGASTFSFDSSRCTLLN